MNTTLTIRGTMLPDLLRPLRHLSIDAELAEAIEVLGVTREALELELALRLHTMVRDTPAEHLPEIPFVWRIPLGLEEVLGARSELTFDLSGTRCEQCGESSNGGRWCEEHAPRCTCCGDDADPCSPEDCAKHAAMKADLEKDDDAA